MPPKKSKTNPPKGDRPKSSSRPKPQAQKADPFASSDEEFTTSRNPKDDSEDEQDVEVVNSDDDATTQVTNKKRKHRGEGSNFGSDDENGDDMDVDVEAESRAKGKSKANQRGGGDEEEDAPKAIPSALIARLLHESFEKDGTRVTGDASRAAAKYVDVFVREAIARCMYEREGGFLEVEDLEKISAQLLMDF